MVHVSTVRPSWQSSWPRLSALAPAHSDRVSPLVILQSERVEPIPRRVNARCCLVDSLDLDALRKGYSYERLKVFEWSVAKSIAEYDRSVGELKRLGHSDTPLSRVTMMPAQEMTCNELVIRFRCESTTAHNFLGDAGRIVQVLSYPAAIRGGALYNSEPLRRDGKDRAADLARTRWQVVMQRATPPGLWRHRAAESRPRYTPRAS
jgi:hypothetical protein